MPQQLRTIDRLHRLVFFAVSVARRTGVPVYRPILDWIHRRPDRWSYESSAYEQQRFADTLSALGAGPYRRALEVACADGVFTAMLARDARIEALLACDVSPRALHRARARLSGVTHVEFRVDDLAGSASLGAPFDLIVCAEVFYYLGGSVGTVARRLTAALAPGGRLVLVHQHPEADAIFEPFMRAPELRLLSVTVSPDSDRRYQIRVLERHF